MFGKVRYAQIPQGGLGRYFDSKDLKKDDEFVVGENEKFIFCQNKKIIKIVNQPGMLILNKKEIPELDCKLLSKDLENCELFATKCAYPTIYTKFVNAKVNKDNKIECTTYNQQYLGMMKFSLVLKIDIINNYEERFVEFTRGLDKGDDNGFCYYNGIRRVIDLLINQWVFDAADSYYKDTPYLEDLQILSIKEYTLMEIVHNLEKNVCEAFKKQLGVEVKAKVLGVYDKYGE